MQGSPKTIVAIRTHRWDEDAQRLYVQFLLMFGAAPIPSGRLNIVAVGGSFDRLPAELIRPH